MIKVKHRLSIPITLILDLSQNLNTLYSETSL